METRHVRVAKDHHVVQDVPVTKGDREAPCEDGLTELHDREVDGFPRAHVHARLLQ